jgi:hypothetical protein
LTQLRNCWRKPEPQLRRNAAITAVHRGITTCGTIGGTMSITTLTLAPPHAGSCEGRA